jgi:RNA polymerase subunit RPABC4/transcription elongation factor Spt4
MATINTLVTETNCPVCAQLSTFRIDFRYGECWMHLYSLGDDLRWGPEMANVGRPEDLRVLVEGYDRICPHCHGRDLNFDISIENNVLTSVAPLRRQPTENGYVVIGD